MGTEKSTDSTMFFLLKGVKMVLVSDEKCLASIEQPILSLPRGVFASDVRTFLTSMQTFFTSQLARFLNSSGVVSTNYGSVGLLALLLQIYLFPLGFFIPVHLIT